MRSILAALALLPLLTLPMAPARAGISFIFMNHTPGCGSPGAYVGPADVSPSLGITYFWGARAFSCAYAAAGGAGMIVQRASDAATDAINFVPSGNLDVVTAAAFCAATTCGVEELVEQVTATTNFSQSTQSLQPQLAFSWYGSKPSIEFIAANSTQLNNVGIYASQPGNISVVVNDVSVPSTYAGFFNFTGSLGQEWSTSIASSGLTSGMSAGASLAGPTISNGTTHSLQFVFNGASSTITVDGSTTTGNAGTNSTFGGTAFFGSESGPTNYLNGYMRKSYSPPTARRLGPRRKFPRCTPIRAPIGARREQR
jgi:hypothetical protein